MRDATHAALAYALSEHERVGFVTDPARLCAALDIRIIPGREYRATAGPPALITQPWSNYAPRQHWHVHHEVAHVLLIRSGLEEDILTEVSEDLAEAHLEAVADYLCAALVMPQPLVLELQRAHGDSPATILGLSQRARVSVQAALYRWVGHNPWESRAAWIESGGYVAHVATCNSRLPFWRFGEARQVPAAVMAAIPQRQALVGVLA